MPKPPTMTHEQRMELIMAPIPRIRYHHALPHAGTIIGDNFYDSECLELVAGFRRARITKDDVDYATRLFGLHIFTAEYE